MINEDAPQQRSCSSCSKPTGVTVSVCPQCGRDSEPAGSDQTSADKPSLLQRANLAIANWETSNASAINLAVTRLQVAIPFPSVLRFALGGLVLALSIAMVPEWVSHRGIASAVNIVSLWIVGLTILAWTLVRKAEVTQSIVQANASPSDTSLHILGYENSLLVIQLIAVAIAIMSGLRAEIEHAWYACLIATLLTLPLWDTGKRAYSTALGTIAAIYLAYLFVIWDFGYVVKSAQQARLTSFYFLILDPIIWIVILIAAVPQLAIPRINSFGIGRLRGDRHVTLFGVRVTLAISSAVFLYCAWRVAWLLWSAPGWLPASLRGV